MVGPPSTSQRLASGPTPRVWAQFPARIFHSDLPFLPSTAYKKSSSDPTKTAPKAERAGELKIKSPVANDQRSLPCRSMACSRPSWLPNKIRPSDDSAGDEVTGPPVSKLQRISGFCAGSR
jgi:hypothetical protein